MKIQEMMLLAGRPTSRSENSKGAQMNLQTTNGHRAGRKDLAAILVDAGAQKANAWRVLITPRLAQTFLARMGHNRPVRRNAVERYKASINDWPYTGEAMIFAASSGQMIDGQHRCIAIEETGVSIWVLVVLDAEDGAYQKLDSGARRLAADYLTCKNRVAVTGAMSMLWTEEQAAPGSDPTSGNHPMPAGEAEGMLARYPELPDLYVTARRVLQPSAQIYTAFRTMAHEPARAAEFWRGFHTGEGLAKGDPRLLLRQRLIAASQEPTSRLTRSTLVALIIKAWTLWLSRKTAGTLRWDVQREAYPRWPGASLNELRPR